MRVRSLIPSGRFLLRSALAVLPLALLAFQPPAARAQQVGIQHVFSNSTTNGQHPTGGLVQGADGNFYGTTARGGASNNGTVYRLTPSNAFTLLYSFTGGADGGEPGDALTVGPDGAFYGTTQLGGVYNEGVVFRIDTSGNFSLLWVFDGSVGAQPTASLLLARDGNFYGTTTGGGLNGYGTVFQVNTSGNFNVIYSFSGPDGDGPISALIQGTDGNLYGTTQYGGVNDKGTAYQITLAGSETVIHSFGAGTGNQPQGALVQAPNGMLYGTAQFGGLYNYGTIFAVSTDGSLFSTVYNFAGSDGSDPQSGMTLASDGNLYGTTYYGGNNDNGTVFRLTPTGGGFAEVLILGNPNGQYPVAPLIQAADGTFYGTASAGGSGDDGTVFRIDVSLSAPGSTPVPVINSAATATATVGVAFSYQITATNSPLGYGAANLPAGLSFNASTGVISGTVATTGTYVIGLSAANAGGTGTASLTLTVQGAPVPAVVASSFMHRASYLGGQDAVFALYLTEATTVNLTINYTLTGPAKNGVDYEPLTGTVTIPAGSTYGLVTIVPTNALRGKGKLGVDLNVAPGDGYTIQTPAARVVEVYYK